MHIIINKQVLIFLGTFSVCLCNAELAAIDDVDMAGISGQGGVYLSGEFSINKNGGPLWTTTLDSVSDNDAPLDAFDEFGVRKEYRNCGTATDLKECGLRFAIKLNENSEGWYVIDDLSGGMSFDGLTLRTRTLTEVPDYNNVVLNSDGKPTPVMYNFSDEGEADQEILEIGLPGTVSFNDFRFKYAVANNGEFGVPLADGTAFKQTEIFGVELDGAITLQGNLLLFPVD